MRAADEHSGSDARNEILRAVLADLEAGREVTVEEYRSRFPGRERIVAEELEALLGEGDAGGDERRFGRYHLLRELGRGGQGAVYLAEDERLGRRVALKVLPRFAFDAAARLRFEREARVASRLDDPVIAAVYDAGEVDGTPYIAMRYVEGEPLSLKLARARAAGEAAVAMVEGRPASDRDAIELAERLARALHRAHAAGVVHRDVKPGNVLVTPEGEPVLLDFGLARDLGATGTGPTHTGDVFGTPAYMAPEQVLGNPAGPATDVHALGALLFECLTLELPFRGATSTALQRAIAEDDPRDPAGARADLSRDLRVVLLTALAKEPARRYGSAEAFADDLRRVLAGEPVRALPPSAWYRARRFVARHRALAVSTTLVIASLAAATAVSTRALLEARAERAVAEETLSAFEDVLGAASHERGGRSVLLTDVLDEASRSLEQELPRSPASAARLMRAIGRVYTGLGEFASAEPLLERALAIQREQRGDERHPDVLAARHALGVLFRDQARYGEAREHLEAVHRARLEEAGPEDGRTLDAALDLGLLLRYQGERERAAELFRRVLERAPVDRARSDWALDALHELAILRHEQGRPDEALELLRESVERTEAARGPDHADTAAARNALGVQLLSLKRLDEAEECFRGALDVFRTQYGAESPRMQPVVGNLAFLLKQRGELEAAEELYREVLAAQERSLEPGHPDTVNTRNNLGRLLQAAGRLEAAEAELRRALEEARGRLGPLDPKTLLVQNNLGLVLDDLGETEDAEAMLAAALRGREEALGPDAPDTLRSVNNLAYLYMETGRDEEALALFERSLAGRARRLGPSHPDTVAAEVNLGWFHHARGMLDEAGRCYARALETCRDAGADLRAVLPLPLRMLARARAEQGRLEEAERLAEELVGLFPEEGADRARALALLQDVRAR